MSDFKKKERNPNNIGGLWKKVSQTTGKQFLSGSIEHNGEKIFFNIFPNTYKENSKQPDYNIIKNDYKAPKDEFIDEMDSQIGTETENSYAKLAQKAANVSQESLTEKTQEEIELEQAQKDSLEGDSIPEF